MSYTCVKESYIRVHKLFIFIYNSKLNRTDLSNKDRLGLYLSN